MNSKIKIAGIIALMMVFFLQTLDVDAQTRRRSRVQQTNPSFSENLWYGIHLGNLDFFSGSFSVSGKFSTAYKLNNNFSAGVAAKSFLDILEVFNGPDLNLFSYGGGVFLRYKIGGGIYAHAEYDITNYEDYNPVNLSTTKDFYHYPLFGGGYESGQGPWTYGFKILFIGKEEVRELVVTDVVEWWITFSYNF